MKSNTSPSFPINPGERHNGLDLLRIIATIAVILIHVNYWYFQYRYEEPVFNYAYVIESLFNIITRFSVPVFFMISGAFVLGNPKNRDFRFFYRKSSYKIGLPVILVVFLFLILDEIYSLVSSHHLSIDPLKAILYGTYYNLWFISALAGLYLLTPVLIRLKETTTVRQFAAISIFMCVWAFGSQVSSTQRFPYTIGVVFAYLSYYLLGYVLFNYFNQRLIRGRARICFLLISLLMIAVTFIHRYRGNSFYLFNAYTNFFSPTIIVYSICVFSFFSTLHIKHSYFRLADLTFHIYLFHTITYTWAFRLYFNRVSGNEIIIILTVSFLTFCIDLVLSMLYKKLWQVLDKKLRLRSIWYALPFWKDSSSVDEQNKTVKTAR